MDETPEEILGNITLFLTSLRQSIEGPLAKRALLNPSDSEELVRTLVMIEEISIRARTLMRFRSSSFENSFKIMREEIFSFFDRFLVARPFRANLREFPFRNGGVSSRRLSNSNPQFSHIYYRNREIDVHTAILEFAQYLNFIKISQSQQSDLPFSALAQIVPPQQIAPVQFEIKNSKIIISQMKSNILDPDKSNVSSALEHIHSSGEKLIANLEASNCDRRLLEIVTELHSQIINKNNIIKIGLSNMACSVMCAQFQSELPDAVVGMLNAYNTGISLYVAQFRDWEIFTQKAASIELNDDDIQSVDVTVSNLLDMLNKNPLVAEPDVPKTIAFVRQFLTLPGKTSKRAVFAMIRTIENLVSSIIRHSLMFFDKTGEQIVELGAKVASATIISLLGIALLSASGIGPAATRAGVPWIQQAAEVVQRQIQKVSE